MIRHPWKGNPNSCPEARRLLRGAAKRRQEHEAQTLASLTGWKLDDIRRGIPTAGCRPSRARVPGQRRDLVGKAVGGF